MEREEGLVSGCPMNMIVDGSHVARRQQLSPRAPPADVDCPRSIHPVGRYLLPCCAPLPKTGATPVVADQPEVGQSARWGGVGQVAKKTQACQQ